MPAKSRRQRRVRTKTALTMRISSEQATRISSTTIYTILLRERKSSTMTKMTTTMWTTASKSSRLISATQMMTNKQIKLRRESSGRNRNRILLPQEDE
jgi:hypothetical protein